MDRKNPDTLPRIKLERGMWIVRGPTRLQNSPTWWKIVVPALRFCTRLNNQRQGDGYAD